MLNYLALKKADYHMKLLDGDFHQVRLWKSKDGADCGVAERGKTVQIWSIFMWRLASFPNQEWFL